MTSKSEITRRPRIGSIDLLRGFFIVVMVIDHIARFPNGLDLISGRNQLWFSGAEGFVTISGLLVGYVYAPKILTQTKLVFYRLFRRAILLYVCVTLLALFFIGYSYYFLEAINFEQFNSFTELLWQLLSLQYSYGWAEFLTHYVIFLIIAPFALWLIVKRYAWIVLTLSLILWISHLWTSNGQTRYEFAASWQILFIAGMYVGTHLLNINAWVRSHFSKHIIDYATYGLWSVAFILFVSASVFSYGTTLISQNIPVLSGLMNTIANFWEPVNRDFFSWWTDKATVAPLRILFGIAIFWALFTFFHRFSKQINLYTHGVFFVLGKQPLFAYCFGAVVIFAIEKYIPPPDQETRHFIANLIITLTAIIITYSFTKLFTRYVTTKSLKSSEFPA